MVRPIAVLSLLLLLAPLVRADDGWKWDPKQRHAPSKGDRWFEEVADVESEQSTVTMGGKVVQDEAAVSKLGYRFTLEVLAAAEGKVTEVRHSFARWQYVGPHDAADATLEGKSVVVKRAGETPTFVVEGEKKDEVSELARGWVESVLASKEKRADEPDTEVCMPDKPLAPDGEWTCDPKVVAKSLIEEAEIIEKDSSVKGKLTGVTVENGVHVGRYEVKAVLHLKNDPIQGLPFSEGGILEFTVSYEGSLEYEKRQEGTTTSRLVLAGTARVGEATDPAGTVKMAILRTHSSKIGLVEK